MHEIELYVIFLAQPPSITTPPSSTTSDEGQNVTLLCGVDGNPLPTVQWYKDGQLLNNTVNPRLTQDNNNSLIITDLTRSDEGFYVCNATNNVSSVASNQTYLTVNYPPRILASPTSESVVESSNVSLTCYLEGKPTTNVTWLKDGISIIPDNDDRISVSQPTSVKNTSSTITITNVYRTDQGNYSCQAVSDVGSDTSSVVSLIVDFGVKIFVHSKPKTRNEVESVNMTCEVEGKPPPEITWLKDGHPLNIDSSRMTVTQPNTYHRTVVYLMISDLNRTDEGDYSCRVNNSLDVQTSTPAKLTVNYPIVIFQNPRNLTKIEGETMVIWCKVEGKPVLDVTWKKDELTLAVDGVRITVNKNSGVNRVNFTLTIANLLRTDEGSYTCTMNNTLNTVVSSPGRLTVNFIILSILNPGANFTVTSGQTAKLLCVVSGQSPVITWYRAGKGIPSTNTRVTSSNTLTADMTVNNVQPEDSGVYECTASSNQKLVSTQMTLVVNVPVEVDMDITVENMEFTEDLYNSSSPLFQSLSDTFKEEMSSIYEDIEGFKEIQILGFSNGSVQVRFRVVFEIKVDKPSNKPPLDVKQKVANVAIKQITKTNGVIGGLKFVPGSITSLVPPPSPRNLTTTHIKEKEISIAWKKPEYHRSYDITGYEVQYKEFAQRWHNIRVYGKEINDHVIHDLKEDTRYSIRMVATNKLGKGPPSDQLEVSTKKESLWNKIWSNYKWVIVAVGIALFLLILTGIFLCCRKRKRKITVKRQQSSRRKQGNFKISGQSFRNQGFEMAQLASRFREIPRDQIMIGKELGSGQFGLVTRGYLKQDKMHCAIKMLKADCSDSHYRDLLNELDIMSSVEEHPNVVNLIGACTQGGPVYVITELAEHGCLLDFLHNNQMYSISHQDRLSILSEAEKIRIGRDVARGLEHLTRFRCVHRDLAARNVLLGTNMTAKLSDFGLARDVYEKGYYQQLSNMKKLPVRWMSIEAIETLVATKESDIWSFGILLWEIHTGGKLPYHGLSAKEILKTLKKGTRPEQPVNCSDEMYSIMRSCWHSSPSKRPTIELLATVLDRQLQLRRNEEALQNSSFA